MPYCLQHAGHNTISIDGWKEAFSSVKEVAKAVLCDESHANLQDISTYSEAMSSVTADTSESIENSEAEQLNQKTVAQETRIGKESSGSSDFKTMERSNIPMQESSEVSRISEADVEVINVAAKEKDASEAFRHNDGFVRQRSRNKSSFNRNGKSYCN
jgi:hypothetical protein